MEEDKKDKDLTISVHGITKEEMKAIGHEYIDSDSPSKSDFVHKCITAGRIAYHYARDNYDLPDTRTMVFGGIPDRDYFQEILDKMDSQFGLDLESRTELLGWMETLRKNNKDAQRHHENL